MQKKLIALAIAAGFSGAAFAQSNVTIYGVADVSFESSKAEGATTGTSIQSRTRINTNGSLIGFKGSEDLGDGLKAIFQMETSINSDGGSSTKAAANTTSGSYSGITAGGLVGSQRDSFVGLAGGFGTVKAGYLSTPTRAQVRGFDVIPGSTGVGEVGGVFAVSPTGNSYLFRSQSIYYATPDFGGFSASAAYSGTESADAGKTVEPKMWNLGLGYTLGGLKLAYSYLDIEDAGIVVVGPPSGSDEKAHFVGASYDFGQGTTIIGQYQDSEVEVPGGDLEKNAFWLGVKHVMGANEFALSYGDTDELEGSLLAPGAGAGTGAKQVAFRYARILSKRTQVYGIYSKITNDSAAAYDFQSAGVGGVAAGADPQSFGVGLRHSF